MSSVTVPGYRIDRLVGRGGVSDVYLSYADGSEEPVAVKVFHAAEVRKTAFRRRVEREIAITTRLDHPGVVSPRDRVSDPSKDLYALVMPYVPGKDLRHVLEEGKLELAEALDFSLAIAEILAYVHSKGVAHLDLKPENVLITPERAVRLTDFGIAQAIHGEMLREGLKTQTLSGTVYYVAPERLVNPDSTDHRADLYALGIMIHEMVMGQRPLAGTHFLDEFDTLHAIADLKTLISKMIQHDPNARYQTATDVMQRLKELESYKHIRRGREAPVPKGSLSVPATTGGATGRMPGPEKAAPSRPTPAPPAGPGSTTAPPPPKRSPTVPRIAVVPAAPLIPDGVSVTEWLWVKITVWLNPAKDHRLTRSRNRAALSGATRGFYESPATLFVGLMGLFAIVFAAWTYMALNAFEGEMTDPARESAPAIEAPAPDTGD